MELFSYVWNKFIICTNMDLALKNLQTQAIKQ